VVIKNGSEAYTSKQCGRCGALNEKLGSSKVFQYPRVVPMQTGTCML
jgi:transposase